MRDAWNRDAGRRFRTILSDKQPDILHTHLIDGLSASIWQRAKKAGMGVLHTAHDYHLLCPRSMMLTRTLKVCNTPQLGCQLYRRWHIGTTRHVDLFCSPSRFLIEKHREAGLLSARTAIVRNGIPLPEPMTREAHSDIVPSRFLFAARLTVEKGCQILLDAVENMPPEANFELTVAGKGPFEEAFRALAARDARVKFLGYIQAEAKTEAFRRCNYLLIPSLWYENAPVVIVEAAAYGMGVIGSRMGAIPEFVRHEETGLLFTPGDAKDLSDAMMRTVREPELLPRFAQAAQKLVAESSVETMVDAYLAEYATLPVQTSRLHG